MNEDGWDDVDIARLDALILGAIVRRMTGVVLIMDLKRRRALVPVNEAGDEGVEAGEFKVDAGSG